MSTPTELPQYRCHKVVRAAKIVGTQREMTEPRGMRLTLALPDGTEFMIDVGPDWFDRKIDLGAYYVVYADGYTSYSPAKAFEEGYTLEAELT